MRKKQRWYSRVGGENGNSLENRGACRQASSTMDSARLEREEREYEIVASNSVLSYHVQTLKQDSSVEPLFDENHRPHRSQPRAEKTRSN